jgi:hypothetical protein
MRVTLTDDWSVFWPRRRCSGLQDIEPRRAKPAQVMLIEVANNRRVRGTTVIGRH